LEQAQQFITCTLLPIIIKSFRENFFLLDRVTLVHPIRHDSVLGRSEFRVAVFLPLNPFQIIHDHADLVFV